MEREDALAYASMSTKTGGFLALYIIEELACRHEPGNVHGPYAVAVTNAIVGHVSRKGSLYRTISLHGSLPLATPTNQKFSVIFSCGKIFVLRILRTKRTNFCPDENNPLYGMYYHCG